MNICSCDLTALVNILRHFCIIGTTGNNNRTLGSLRKKKHTKKSQKERNAYIHIFRNSHRLSRRLSLIPLTPDRLTPSRPSWRICRRLVLRMVPGWGRLAVLFSLWCNMTILGPALQQHGTTAPLTHWGTHWDKKFIFPSNGPLSFACVEGSTRTPLQQLHSGDWKPRMNTESVVELIDQENQERLQLIIS